MHLGQLLDHHARYRADHPALEVGKLRLNFRELHRRVDRVAHALRSLGLAPGESVATLLPNCVELVELYWAAAKSGLVVVPLSPLLREDAVATLLEDAQAKCLIAHHSLAGVAHAAQTSVASRRRLAVFIVADPSPSSLSFETLVEAASPTPWPSIELAEDHPCNIMYSSGTTGMPKGIVLSHRVRLNYCTHFASAYRMIPESVVMHAGSLVFNGAFLTLMPALYLGCRYVLQEHFRPEEVIEAIERERVTHIEMVPSQIAALLSSPAFDASRLRSLQMVGSVGAPLLLEQKRALQRELPGVFYELYGLTEGFVTLLDREAPPSKLASVGRPPVGSHLRIVSKSGDEVPLGEVGEIVGRGPLLMSGYHGRADLTQEAIRDGWLHTGDLGRLDEDGYLYLVDRKKDLIISGGVNIYPRDIEEVAIRHEAVAEVAVFGVPDASWGEKPIAAIVPHPGKSVDAVALRAWINERVSARYQKLAEVILRQTLPRNAAGKTLKRELREQYQNEHHSERA